MQPLDRRILLVDDDGETCAAMAVMLEPSGYEVVPACTLAEALSLAESGFFDLYLLDQKFPEGSGLELCRRIRQFDAETPILFYSALGRSVDKQMAMAAGAQGYLKKPASLDVLEVTISHLIDVAEQVELKDVPQL